LGAPESTQQLIVFIWPSVSDPVFGIKRETTADFISTATFLICAYVVKGPGPLVLPLA
jgi:hypothetical protein